MKLKKRTTPEQVSVNEGNAEKKEKIGRLMLLPIFFCLGSGLLLILLKDLTMMITGYVFSAGLITLGVWLIIVYIRSEPMVRILESKLAIGLILLVTGIMLAFSPEALRELLPYVWGLALLFGGFLKIQYAFDRKSLGSEKWWILLIMAAVSIIIGVISLLNPDFLGDKKELVTGILLLLEAVLDITVFLMLKRTIRKRTEAPQQAPAAPETPVEPAQPEESFPETEA